MKKRNEKEKKWHVLYVKPRQEFKAAKRLEQIGIQTYVPFKTEVRQWSDRKKKIKTPLLPSMILIHIHESQVSQVFTIPGLIRFLFEQGQRAKVSEREIEAIRCYVSGKLDGSGNCLSEGDTVVVPSLHIEAKVLRIEGKKCLAKLQQLGVVVSFQLS